MWNTIRERIPPKEQVYFAVAVLLAAYLLLSTPTSTPGLEEVRRNTIADNAGSLGVDRVAGLLEEAKEPIPAPESTRFSKMEEALTRCFRPVDVERGRNLYLRDGDRVFSLPPVTFGSLPGLPPVPDYEVSIGDAPGIKYQERPQLPGTGRIDLNPPEEVIPFEDRKE